jgi:hypothetical protein
MDEQLAASLVHLAYVSVEDTRLDDGVAPARDANTVEKGSVVISFPWFNILVHQRTYVAVIEHITAAVYESARVRGDDTFKVHVFLDSLTMAHVEAHLSFIKALSEALINVPLTMSLCIVHNAPYIFKKAFVLIRRFIPREVQPRIVVIGKKDAPGAV